MTRNRTRAAWARALAATTLSLTLGLHSTASLAVPVAHDMLPEASLLTALEQPQDPQPSVTTAGGLPGDVWWICACYTLVYVNLPFEIVQVDSGATPFAVPEPGTLGLLGLGVGLAGIAAARRRRH
jgi:hypothetical protein